MRSSYLDIGACTSNDGASPESSRRKLPCLQGLSTPIIVGTVPYLISFAPPYRSHLISFAPLRPVLLSLSGGVFNNYNSHPMCPSPNPCIQFDSTQHYCRRKNCISHWPHCIHKTRSLYRSINTRSYCRRPCRPSIRRNGARLAIEKKINTS